ncbi:MAG: LCP family protein [Clostridiales bacterium]|jgi:LCP family protein required for cell wall assembly|nr:LCP family protein [Clostridiales bacterium]
MPKRQNKQAPAHDAATADSDRKKSPLRTMLLILLCLMGVAVLTVAGLLLLLPLRMAAPGAYTFGDEDPAIASPTALPAQPFVAASTTPPLPLPPDDEEEVLDPALEFEPLPLADLFNQTQLTQEQLALMENQAKDTVNYTHVLLVGVDRRGAKGNSNADTIMIATIDKKNGRLKLTSVLRDCYVPIEGFIEDRINSAATAGGIPLLMHTVNELLHLNITNYVLVDFLMFESVVDKLGGVGVNMTEKEISAANDNIAGLNKQRGVEYLWDGFIFANPGSVRLDGKQALAYARIRKIDSDFSRTNRQFKVLNAIYAGFRSKSTAEQYALLYDLMPLVETDLSVAQILDMVVSALSLDSRGISHERVPFDTYYKSGSVKRKSALVLDMPMNAWLAHDFIFNSKEEPASAKNLPGGPSLPPRTPGPTLPLDAYGLPVYTDGTTLAPGETDNTDGDATGQASGQNTPAQNNLYP